MTTDRSATRTDAPRPAAPPGGRTGYRDVVPPLLVTAVLALMLAARAMAQAPPELGRLQGEGFRVEPDGVEVGVLRSLPLQQVTWDVEVVGPAASLVLEQVFVNDSDLVLEAAYTFPLPPGAAIAHFEIEVGDRLLEGVVREKAEARREFEVARAEGRRASLLEQHRSDVFSARVTNLSPGDVVLVRLVVGLTVERADSWWSLRLPLTTGGAEAGAAAARAASSAARAPRARATGSFEVDVAVAFPPELSPVAVESPTHPMHELEPDPWRRFSLDAHGADRDVLVRWRFGPDEIRAVASPADGSGLRDVLLTLKAPKRLEASALRSSPPKELLVVLDTSSSMGDGSLDAAVRALHDVVAALGPDERFDVVEYDHEFSRLFGEPRFADPGVVAEAHRWLDALQADGGTTLLPALVAALRTPGSSSHHRVVVVLTDGQMGGDEQILAALADDLGDARLHVVGIGSAPNAHLAREMAQVGRGTATFLSPGQSVADGARRLLRRIERPLGRDLALDWGGALVGDVHPHPLPDLHAGTALAVTATVRDAPLEARLSLETADGSEVLREPVDLDSVATHPIVSVLRARAEIEALEDELRLLRGGAGTLAADERAAAIEAVRAELVEISLAEQLVSSETSFVVVETVRTAPAGGPDVAADAEGGARAGWPTTATRRPLRLLAGLVLLALGAAGLAAGRACGASDVRGEARPAAGDAHAA